LRNTIVRHVQNGNGNRIPIIRKDAHHPNLATNQALTLILILVHFFSIPAYDWAGLIYGGTASNTFAADPHKTKNMACNRLSRRL
jgi:hypothetical protein